MFRRLWKDFQGDVVAIPGRFLALLFFLILLIIPLITSDSYLLRTLAFANIFAIFAVSWDLLSGYTGQINFGHALFFGVAAYTSALLNLKLGWMPWLTIPIGALASVVAGVIVCLPALRLRGPYLSLVTLAFPLILLGVIFAFTDFTGGELGVSGITRIYPKSPDNRFYISLVVMLISVMVMWKLTDAKSALVRTGIIFHAIREDEIAARASGINTIRYKMLAFVVGGFFAGIAGAFYAHFTGTAGPTNLSLFLSFQVIIWTVFGGITSIYGPVVGVFIMFPLMEYLPIILAKMQFFKEMLSNFTEIRMMIFAIIVVVVLLFMPEGIAVFIRDKMERTCPRCKLQNVWWRKNCRACDAELR